MYTRKPSRNNTDRDNDRQRTYFMIAVEGGRPKRGKRDGNELTVNDNTSHKNKKEVNKNGNRKENDYKR